MRTFVRRTAWGLTVTAGILLALFCWNGLGTDWKNPVEGQTGAPERTLQFAPGATDPLTVMAWNIAKCDFHAGGLDFLSKSEVKARLDQIAEVIRSEDVDLLFLSEVVLEAAPCNVNQVAYLASQAGFAHWCYGDNYSFGIPGARIRSGNALLSRLPLEGTRVEQLPGGTPFWRPTGNRRLLWAKVSIGSDTIDCASLRNDSFDLVNNARQVRTILGALPASPSIIAGDFNATPGSAPMDAWEDSGRFAGVFEGPATFPSSGPNRRLDTVLIPREWAQGLDATWTSEVLDVDLSDHEPVVVRITAGS